MKLPEIDLEAVPAWALRLMDKQPALCKALAGLVRVHMWIDGSSLTQQAACWERVRLLYSAARQRARRGKRRSSHRRQQRLTRRLRKRKKGR